MTYIIKNKSLAGQTVYFDGFGFSLLAASAVCMNACEGVLTRSAICHEFPACQLVAL